MVVQESPRRYVPRSEKVFYLEQSKKKVQVEEKWHEEVFLGIKYESDGIVFARSMRRVPKEDSGMLCNSIRGLPMGLTAWCREREREIVNRVQLDVKAAVPGRQAPPPTTGEQLRRRVYIRRVELAKYGYTDQCIGCQELKPADHSEECRARIIRQMSVDVDLSQRVQIA